MFAGMPKEKESILRKSYRTLVVALLIKDILHVRLILQC